MPVDGLGNAAGVGAVDDFFQAGNNVGMAVVAQFDHDPAATHFVGDCASGAGTGEGIEDEIAGVGGDCENPGNQTFWLGGCKDIFFTKK